MTDRQARNRPQQWWHDVGPHVTKRVLNPLMVHLAGRRFWYTALIEHVGRRSGRTYRTPVAAKRVAGGFVVPLTYGPERDWVRNTLAVGRAVLVLHGTRHVVGDPRVVHFQDVEAELNPMTRRVLLRLLGEGTPFLRLSTVEQ